MNLVANLTGAVIDRLTGREHERRLSGREQERQLAELRALTGYRPDLPTVPDRPPRHSR